MSKRYDTSSDGYEKRRHKADRDMLTRLENTQRKMAIEGTRRLEARGPTAMQDVRDVFKRAGKEAPRVTGKKTGRSMYRRGK